MLSVLKSPPLPLARTRVGRPRTLLDSRNVECYVEDINAQDINSQNINAQHSHDRKYSMSVGCARGSDPKKKAKGKSMKRNIT